MGARQRRAVCGLSLSGAAEFAWRVAYSAPSHHTTRQKGLEVRDLEANRPFCVLLILSVVFCNADADV
jgi:hypothetical protein